MANLSVRSIGITALVLFLLHGQLSAALPLLEPLQLPLAAIAATCSILLVLPLRRSIFASVVVTIIAAYFVLAAPAVSVATNYSDSKPTNLLLTIGFTLLVPPLLIRRQNDLQRLLNTLGLVAVFATLAVIISGNFNQQGRLTLGEEGNPIWLGRAAGLAIVWLTWRVLTSQSRPHLLLLFLPSLFVLIATGSRGPLLASLVGLIILTLTTRPKISRPIAGLSLTFVAFLIALMTQLPTDGFSQIFNRGEDISSGRNDLISIALSFIEEYPNGIGVGGLDAWLGAARYPHNVIVEALAELGWLAGILLTIGLLLVFWKYSKISQTSSYSALLLALFVYSLLNSMLSGDLTSPKELYLICSLSILVPRLHQANRRAIYASAIDIQKDPDGHSRVLYTPNNH